MSDIANKIRELQDSLESGQAFMFQIFPEAPTRKQRLHDLCDSLRIPKYVRWPLIIFNLILFAIVAVAFLCCVFDLSTPGNIGNWISNNKRYIPAIILCVMIVIDIIGWCLCVNHKNKALLVILLSLSLICLCGFYWLFGSDTAEFLQRHWKMILGGVVAVSIIVGIIIDKNMM